MIAAIPVHALEVPVSLAGAISGPAGARVPGVSVVLTSIDIGGTTGFSINGRKKGDNELLIEGMSDVRGNRTAIGAPSMEAVREFKVLTSTHTYGSQYGRTGGGFVTRLLTREAKDPANDRQWESSNRKGRNCAGVLNQEPARSPASERKGSYK